MAAETLLEQWVREYSQDPNFVAEGLATATIEQVISKLDELKVNQSWLANAMQVPRQQVSRMLNAPPNLTLLSIARLAIALDVKPLVILDSERYFVRQLYGDYGREEAVTDLQIQKTSVTPASTELTTNLPLGVMANAAT
ncbi:MAG: hypothetical protein Q7K03_01565 [Dehalococcoidia bacterium]|nr:hypothetical protein [Dehalococcoidia bacterium]